MTKDLMNTVLIEEVMEGSLQVMELEGTGPYIIWFPVSLL